MCATIRSLLWMGVKESYFIVEQTFTVLGRIITGRESAKVWVGLFVLLSFPDRPHLWGWLR